MSRYCTKLSRSIKMLISESYLVNPSDCITLSANKINTTFGNMFVFLFKVSPSSWRHEPLVIDICFNYGNENTVDCFYTF